jgi:septal ring factor EnvC (AmiA/AmiB activator)
MINLDFFTKNRLFLISTGLWIVILFTVVTCNTNNSSSNRKLIKSITHSQDSLKSVLKDREKDISILTELVKKTEMKLDTINFTNDILKKKIQKYEKAYSSIYSMSTDDNILFLAKYLSTETSNR